MVGSLKTLAEAVRHNMIVVAKCRPCGREGRFMARDLAQYKGWEANPWKLKFRCNVCDSVEMKISCEMFDPDPRRVQIVWKPTEVKR